MSSLLRDLKLKDIGSDLESTSVHPRSTDQPHVLTWKTLGDDVTQSIKRAYPNKNRSSYNGVHVLLLNWEADNLGTFKEIDDLHHLFEDRFYFNVKLWRIPSSRSSNQLESRIVQFRESYDSPSHLLIIYYGGHGVPNRENKSIWAANGEDDSPCLDWSAIQPSLIRAESDVLFLLDCCYAATAATRGIQGQKEVLAACSVESETIGVSDKSFTRNLIEEMDLLKDAEFNVTTLHARLMQRRGNEKLRYTPIHASLSMNKSGSITLIPGPPPPLYAHQDSKSSASKDDNGSHLTSLKPAAAAFTEQLHDGDTRVMICARLKASNDKPSAEEWYSYLVEGAPDEIEDMAVWLEPSGPKEEDLVPASPVEGSVADKKSHSKRLMRSILNLVVKSEKAFDSHATLLDLLVKFEKAFDGHSTLLLISVPIPIWDFLADNPAYSFVGFIRSDCSEAAPQLIRRRSGKLPVETRSQGPHLELLTFPVRRHWLWIGCLPVALVGYVLVRIWLVK